MAADTDTVVNATDYFTQRWIDILRWDENVAVSGFGAWNLFVALLMGADGDALQQLEATYGVEKPHAASTLGHARQLVASMDGVKEALGIWVHDSSPVYPGFIEDIEPVSVGQLPIDISELDRWVSNHTDGMLKRFPTPVDNETVFAAASVLLAEGRWIRPFSPRGDNHPWRGGIVHAESLERSSSDLDESSILSYNGNTISRLLCQTDASFDVHLIAGDAGDHPGQVFDVGFAALQGAAEVTVGSELEVGASAGCLKVTEIDSFSGEPVSRSIVPAFDFSCKHNLLRNSAVFGLEAATKNPGDHFPGISASPLVISAAAQSVAARFSAVGFKAAAVTSVSMALGSAPPQETKKVRSIETRLYQPFGFLVVDRPTNLVMFAGWVAEP